MANVFEAGSTSAKARPPTADELVALLGPAVNQLFTVTLELAAAAMQANAPVAQRLFDAIEQVDDATRQLRESLLSDLGVNLPRSSVTAA